MPLFISLYSTQYIPSLSQNRLNILYCCFFRFRRRILPDLDIASPLQSDTNCTRFSFLKLVNRSSYSNRICSCSSSIGTVALCGTMTGLHCVFRACSSSTGFFLCFLRRLEPFFLSFVLFLFFVGSQIEIQNNKNMLFEGNGKMTCMISTFLTPFLDQFCCKKAIFISATCS